MTVAEAFDRLPLLRALPGADRERLMPVAQLRTLRAGEACWTEGQPSDDFVFVLCGRMKLVKIGPEGRNTILETVATGRLMCGSVVFCFAPRCCTSLPMEDETEVLSLPRRDVLDLVERNPAAGRGLMREITERSLDLCQRVQELGGGPVERRMALLLLKLGDRAGVLRADGTIRVSIRLSRQDLADMCGTTIETAIRVMSRLRKAGTVSTIPAGFLIADRAALAATARGKDRAPGALVPPRLRRARVLRPG